MVLSLTPLSGAAMEDKAALSMEDEASLDRLDAILAELEKFTVQMTANQIELKSGIKMLNSQVASLGEKVDLYLSKRNHPDGIMPHMTSLPGNSDITASSNMDLHRSQMENFLLGDKEVMHERIIDLPIGTPVLQSNLGPSGHRRPAAFSKLKELERPYTYHMFDDMPDNDDVPFIDPFVASSAVSSQTQSGSSLGTANNIISAVSDGFDMVSTVATLAAPSDTITGGEKDTATVAAIVRTGGDVVMGVSNLEGVVADLVEQKQAIKVDVMDIEAVEREVVRGVASELHEQTRTDSDKVAAVGFAISLTAFKNFPAFVSLEETMNAAQKVYDEMFAREMECGQTKIFDRGKLLDIGRHVFDGMAPVLQLSKEEEFGNSKAPDFSLDKGNGAAFLEQSKQIDSELERELALHVFAAKSSDFLIDLHFLPFSSPTPRMEKIAKAPSVYPILNTCHSESYSLTFWCGFATVHDSFGHSQVVGITSSYNCFVLEMKSGDAMLPLHCDVDLGSDSSTKTVIPDIISTELLSGPKVISLPPSITLISLTLDSIEGRSTLHHYIKLFHENCMEYAHKVYIEFKHHGEHLKMILADLHKRLHEAKQLLLNFETTEASIENRLVHAFEGYELLEKRLQKLQKLPGARKKPLSRAEHEFKVQLDSLADLLTGKPITLGRTTTAQLRAKSTHLAEKVVLKGVRMLGKVSSFLEEDAFWICGWHFCFIFNQLSKFQWFCYPSSLRHESSLRQFRGNAEDDKNSRVGYCSEHGQHLLVSDFQRIGSLHELIHLSYESSQPLTWNAPVKIALGSIRALGYLHEDCSPPTVHKNLTPVNILLGGNEIIVLFFWDRHLNSIQTVAYHLLHFVATAVIVNKRRRNMLKALLKVIKQKQHSYKDPIVEFLADFPDFNLEDKVGLVGGGNVTGRQCLSDGRFGKVGAM